MRGALLIAASLCIASPAHANGWIMAVDARAGAAVETDEAAPSERAAITPVVHLTIARRLGASWLLGGRVRAGFPAYYGQLGADLGVTREWRTGGPTLFAGAAAGVVYTYHDASPEVRYDDDAMIYWGPLLRAECGARWWRVPAATHLDRIGFELSLGSELIRSRYSEPDGGHGTRAAFDVGAGVVVEW